MPRTTLSYNLNIRSFSFALFIILFLLMTKLVWGNHNQANPSTEPTVVIHLANGDKVSGELVSVDNEKLDLKNNYGQFTILVGAIKSWQTLDEDLRQKLSTFVSIKDVDTLAKEAREAKENDLFVNAKNPSNSPAPATNVSKTDHWKRQVNFAYTMTHGNIQSSDMNFAFNASRSKGTNKVAVKTFGRYGVNNGKQSSNLFLSSFRVDRSVFKLPFFTESQFEVDKLKKLDYRVSENIGLSYPLLKGDDKQLAFDFGAGLTKEYYETGLQRLNSTSLLRLTAKQKINEKTLLNQQATLFSDLGESGAYRVMAEASLTTPITKHLALRLSGINRYDARPLKQVKPNDFTLLTGFTFDF